MVRGLGQHLADYDATHYEKAKRVLKYLKATADYALRMRVERQDKIKLEAYTDAVYANDRDDRKSISGCVTFIGGSAISYGCVAQAAAERAEHDRVGVHRHERRHARLEVAPRPL